jgi:MoaA/NifB/PqqE/SkfB family radical SAM enzyme
MIGRLSSIKQAIWQILGSKDTSSDVAVESSIAQNHQNLRNTPVCLAPWTSINFTIDGYATVCCLNRKTSVKVAGSSIDAIWNSREFNTLRESVQEDDLKYDCGICNEQIIAGNLDGVKARSYDDYTIANPFTPRVMEFCLDNTCNLACTMCNSILSSTIRQRNKLPRFESKYDDSFVEQLESYIPHLQSAVFSGGEPFLIPIYYKIWERMVAINPKLKICVVTNGTRLDNRIKALLERGNFQINVSIDAVEKSLYESIRINATFEQVMHNLDWFIDYGQRKKNPVNLPMCPLALNRFHIPEMVRFANQKNVSLNFVYVDRPATLTLTNKPAAYLQEMLDCYDKESFDVANPISRQNVARFNGFVKDVQNWMASAETQNILPLTKQWDTENYIETLNDLVDSTDDVWIQENTEARQELKTLIVAVLDNVEPTKRSIVFERLSNQKLSEVYNHVKGKQPKELLFLFGEFIGQHNS